MSVYDRVYCWMGPTAPDNDRPLSEAHAEIIHPTPHINYPDFAAIGLNASVGS